MNTQLSYTIDQVMNLTGIGRTKLYQELNAGRLKGVKVGRKTLITDGSLKEWLKSLSAYESKKAKSDNEASDAA